MLSASLTWLALTWILGTISENEIKGEPEELIKEESEELETSEESSGIKKEEPESRLLSDYPAEGEGAGQGSGLESAEARGLQKRRSHTTPETD